MPGRGSSLDESVQDLEGHSDADSDKRRGNGPFTLDGAAADAGYECPLPRRENEGGRNKGGQLKGEAAVDRADSERLLRERWVGDLPLIRRPHSGHSGGAAPTAEVRGPHLPPGAGQQVPNHARLHARLQARLHTRLHTPPFNFNLIAHGLTSKPRNSHFHQNAPSVAARHRDECGTNVNSRFLWHNPVLGRPLSPQAADQINPIDTNFLLARSLSYSLCAT